MIYDLQLNYFWISKASTHTVEAGARVSPLTGVKPSLKKKESSSHKSENINSLQRLYLPFHYGREIVPQRVICQKCGTILYEGLELKPPDEIIQSHDGKCPACGKKLSFIPKNVEVKAAD